MCTHDFDGGVVLIQVDTNDEHGCVGRWRGDDDFLRATLQVGRSPMMLTINQDDLVENVKGLLLRGGKDTLHRGNQHQVV
jgi:hypothetical protein